ncbi:response regulator transcription factor [Vibrio kyushuensis]|uniref:helix-turn-helix transcriptional regulator n=1 Tax=Vibrio kyushuensis TaxID=2910249 RepID=UPI003D0CB132
MSTTRITHLAEINSLESQLLEMKLTQIPNTSLKHCSAEQFSDAKNLNKTDLAIIDYQYMKKLIEADTLPNFDLLQIQFLVLNVPDQVNDTQFLQFNMLSGLLTRSCRIEHLAKSIEYILSGGLWFPRHFLELLIFNSRNPNSNTQISFDSLTLRERQVLNLLTRDVSNLNIAEQLFLSEYTVKTHVYNLFKKLNVHTRSEAKKVARQIQLNGHDSKSNNDR